MMKSATQAQPSPSQHVWEEDALSALLDGELSDAEARRLLVDLGVHDSQRHRLQEYMAVGDALRGMHAATVAPDLTDRVMAALEQEPTVLAPMRRPTDRRPAFLLAAAAVGALSWGLWNRLPDQAGPAPLAANTPPAQVDVQPYLAAHQDFAQAVIAPAQMNFTQVSLAEVRP